MHTAVKKSRWIGTGFSMGHMVSVLAEMILIIYVIGSIVNTDNLAMSGGIIGVIVLGMIGGINIYSMKKWGKSGSAILASKILNKTGVLGPVGSALVTGLVFGLGFDTATQISALTLSAVASATVGVQTSLVLAGFFALGMIPIDTLDSVILYSTFSKIIHTRAFRYMSYALSGVALLVAVTTTYQMITKSEILPKLTGTVLAISIVSSSFAFAFLSRKTRMKTNCRK